MIVASTRNQRDAIEWARSFVQKENVDFFVAQWDGENYTIENRQPPHYAKRVWKIEPKLGDSQCQTS